MRISQMTMKLTPDELETLGSALEQSVRNEYRLLAGSKMPIEDMCMDEIKLLQDFTMYGYELWMNPTKTDSFGHPTDDVDEWLKSVENEK